MKIAIALIDQAVKTCYRLLPTVALFRRAFFNIEVEYEPSCDGLREHFSRTDNCGKLDRWQKLTELMWSAKRSFKRKSGSVGMLSSQSGCHVRSLVASVLMKCTATGPRILRTT